MNGAVAMIKAAKRFSVILVLIVAGLAMDSEVQGGERTTYKGWNRVLCRSKEIDDK